MFEQKLRMLSLFSLEKGKLRKREAIKKTGSDPSQERMVEAGKTMYASGRK